VDREAARRGAAPFGDDGSEIGNAGQGAYAEGGRERTVISGYEKGCDQDAEDRVSRSDAADVRPSHIVFDRDAEILRERLRREGGANADEDERKRGEPRERRANHGAFVAASLAGIPRCARRERPMLVLVTIFDVINSIAQVGTLLVFAATAAAGLVQLRHLRASNELEGLLRLTEHLREPELQRAFKYVQSELGGRLESPAYRAELARIGFIDAGLHPEMDVCNWFNEVGALVRNRVIDEAIFLELFNRLVTYYWTKLSPVIAILRRLRGPTEYENFEFLAQQAATWQTQHPNGKYPKALARMPLADRYAAVDAT
jgi:hypothetical protein